MARWLDPPHDRVRLTLVEVTTLDRMEEQLRKESEADVPAGRRRRRAKRRQARYGKRHWCRSLLRSARAARPLVWLLPIGFGVMLAGLAGYEALCTIGAGMAGVGLWACLRPTRATRRGRWLTMRCGAAHASQAVENDRHDEAAVRDSEDAIAAEPESSQRGARRKHRPPRDPSAWSGRDVSWWL